jgi:Fe-S cluster assembly ATPase SufC
MDETDSGLDIDAFGWLPVLVTICAMANALRPERNTTYQRLLRTLSSRLRARTGRVRIR